MCDGLLCTKMVKYNSIVVQVANVHAVNAKWLWKHSHTIHYNRDSVIYVRYCTIFCLLCRIQWLTHGQATLLQYYHATKQIRYLIVHVLRSFCGCNYLGNCSQCQDASNHHNYAIVYVWYHCNLFI